MERFEGSIRDEAVPCEVCGEARCLFIRTSAPPVLELRLEHELIGLDWRCPLEVKWQGQVYRFASAILHQPGHWSSRCLVDDGFYGGQILEGDVRLGWRNRLHRLPNLDGDGWCSGPVAAPVLLYFVREDPSLEELGWTELTNDQRSRPASVTPSPQPPDSPHEGSPSTSASLCEERSLLPYGFQNKRALQHDDDCIDEQSVVVKRPKTNTRVRRARDSNGRFVKRV